MDEPRWPIDRIGLILGPVAMIAWLAIVPQGELSPQAFRLAGVLLLTIIWWLTEPIPIPATALLAVALCVFMGAVPGDANSSAPPAKVALAPFADPSAFFLLGGMFIGRAMSKHGLDRRLALSILTTRWAGRSPGTVLAAVGISVTLVSMWISNTAATAMVYPVTMGIIGVLGAGSGLGEHSFSRAPFASALLLMTAYASSVGGIATPIGTGTNVVAMAYFRQREYFGRSADFAQWMMVGVPLMVVMFAGLFVWLRLLAPPGQLNLPALRAFLAGERAKLGPWKQGEINTLAVFLIVVALWITPAVLAFLATDEIQKTFSSHFPEEIVSLLAPVLLYLLPIDWRKREFSLAADDFRQLDWGTILLFGAGLSLGTLMFKTGLAEVLGRATVNALGTDDVWVITALAIAGGILLSEFTSNAATASALIPVVYAICKETSIGQAVIPLMGVTFGASFGSALPVSTPPNAIVYGSGLIKTRRMIAAGIGMDVLSGVAIWIVLRVAGGMGWNPFLQQ